MRLDRNILKAVKSAYHKEFKFKLGEGFYLSSCKTKSIFGNQDEWYFLVKYDDKHYKEPLQVGHFFYDHWRYGVMSVEECAEKVTELVTDFYTKITSKEDFTLLDLKSVIGSPKNRHSGEWDFFNLIFVKGKFWGSIQGEDVNRPETDPNNNVYEILVRPVGKDNKEYIWHNDLDQTINNIGKDWDIKKWRLV